MAEYLIQDTTLTAIADAIRQYRQDAAPMTPAEMPVKIAELAESWAGELTFSGDYATATYFTEAGCSLSVDKQKGMAFLTIQAGTSTNYENIYFYDSDTYMQLPEGVTFLPNQKYGGGTSGEAGKYFTAVFTGITGKINVAVELGNYNGTYDYVRPTVIMTYA